MQRNDLKEKYNCLLPVCQRTKLGDNDTQTKATFWLGRSPHKLFNRGVRLAGVALAPLAAQPESEHGSRPHYGVVVVVVGMTPACQHLGVIEEDARLIDAAI